MDSKYISVYNDILKKIEDKFFNINSKLPSEKELMESYQVSRDTVRKALKLLEEGGYIHKIKGKGSVILDINKFRLPVSGITSFKELSKELGLQSETLLFDLSMISGDKSLRASLELQEQEILWRVVRVRKISGERVILDKDFINSSIINNLSEEVCKDSIYDYIEKELGLKIAYAQKEITMETATDEDRRLLDCQGYDMIVVVKSYTYLDDTRLFQYTESRHRPDRFRFVDFARRI